MKTLVIWILDKLSILLFLLLLVGGGIAGSVFGTQITNYADPTAVIDQNVAIAIGVVVAFLVGVLVFGFLFIFLSMEKTLRDIKGLLKNVSD
jgi:hypothetical protein